MWTVCHVLCESGSCSGEQHQWVPAAAAARGCERWDFCEVPYRRNITQLLEACLSPCSTEKKPFISLEELCSVMRKKTRTQHYLGVPTE